MTYNRDTATVNRYLAFVNDEQKMGRRSPEWTAARVEQLTRELADNGITWTVRLAKTQRLHDLLDQQEAATDDPTAAFVECCTRYSIERGITDAAWRECGVPASVLKAADAHAAKVTTNGKGTK